VCLSKPACLLAPRLELGFEASKESARKRKDDASAGLARKRVKVYGWKATTPKASTTPKGTGAALSNAAPLKAASSKATPAKADAAPKASAPSKAGAPTKATVQKSTLILSVLKAGVLKIGDGGKRPSVESLPAPKGKHAKVTVVPPLVSAPAHQTIVRPQPPMKSDDG
jgi:hypothetical protein